MPFLHFADCVRSCRARASGQRIVTYGAHVPWYIQDEMTEEMEEDEVEKDVRCASCGFAVYGGWTGSAWSCGLRLRLRLRLGAGNR